MFKEIAAELNLPLSTTFYLVTRVARPKPVCKEIFTIDNKDTQHREWHVRNQNGKVKLIYVRSSELCVNFGSYPDKLPYWQNRARLPTYNKWLLKL